ncbi:hypothetical protein DBT_0545 [Dissulfuribacter thermophilus]|uniref:DUF2802 domain-containing protein n=1 Tax=Dissulfuribacter thermophilus TaxID=1156395 RepID=A0A1B9F881_9BACT|nr:hypothetical protein [Dissulfuribacter thermophilus]OCC16083.1 hypothetical protein DBT_0545 [Dissulfuribacter thermophilus]
MNFEVGLNVLILFQIIIDLILIVAFWAIYRRLTFLDPKKIERLIKILKESQELTTRLQEEISATSKAKVKKTAPIDVYTEIKRLSSMGKSVEEIADRLGLTQTEVELALAKRPK